MDFNKNRAAYSQSKHNKNYVDRARMEINPRVIIKKVQMQEAIARSKRRKRVDNPTFGFANFKLAGSVIRYGCVGVRIDSLKDTTVILKHNRRNLLFHYACKPIIYK